MGTAIDRLKKEARGAPLRAALYARFSSDNQRDESIDAQIRAIKTYAQNEGIIIVDEYIDRAKSATTDERPEFQRMIKDSAAGGFNLVLVHKLDRFSRNRNDSNFYRMKLRHNRVRLLSVLEPLDDSPEAVILESVLEGMAEFYSKNLAREVKKGLKENALKCLHTGGIPPLGYDVDKTTKKLVVNEKEAEAVRIIFDMIIQGYGYSEIVKRLKKEGFKTKAGKDFGKNSIFEILRNRKYKGDYIYNRTRGRDPYTKKRNSHEENFSEDIIVIANGVPAIISAKDFDKVQEILNNRRVWRHLDKRQIETYLLTGKIFCGDCGCAYVGNRKKSSGNRKPIVTYRCNNRNRKATAECKNREINRDYIEAFVLEKIEESIFSKQTVKRIMEQMESYFAQENAKRNKQIGRLKDELVAIEKKQLNITEILAEGVSKLQQGALLGKLEEFEQQKTDIQSRLTKEELTIEREMPDEKELHKCMLRARELFRKKSLDCMQQLVEMFVEKIIVKADEVEVILNLVPFLTKDTAAGHRLILISRVNLRQIDKVVLGGFRSLLLVVVISMFGLY